MQQFATFYIGENLFGLDVLLVREINRNLDFTFVDRSSEYVVGLLNLRGQIVTVLDLGVRLGLGKRNITEGSRCVVLKTNAELPDVQKENGSRSTTADEIVGLLVDRIGDMVVIDEKEIEAPPANVGAVDGKFLSGVVKMENSLLVLLKTKEMLAIT
ncbi:MAG: chemotaxis protein CheW [Chitinivibrionales bacterium]